MPVPSLALQQYGSRALDEQRSQIAIAPLRYAAENRPAAGRYLFWYKAEPRCEVSTFGECIAGPDRGDHCARYNRSDAWRTHQSTAVFILLDERFNLCSGRRHPRIEIAPVCGQILDQPDYLLRQYIRLSRQDLWKGPIGARLLLVEPAVPAPAKSRVSD